MVMVDVDNSSLKADSQLKLVGLVSLIEEGLMSHQTHYRSYRGQVYGSNDPTNSVKAVKEDRILRIRLQSHQIHPTVLTIIQQYETKTHKIHTDKHK